MISFWQGNDILSNIRQDEYEEVIQMLENAILATDLALYFKYAFIFSVICLKSTPLFEFLFLSAKFFFVSWKYWPCRVQIIAWWTGGFCGLVYFVFCSVWFLWAYWVKHFTVIGNFLVFSFCKTYFRLPESFNCICS